MGDTAPQGRIPILVCADLQAEHAFLVRCFGLTPGELSSSDDGLVVHAEVHAGDGVIWLHRETADRRLVSPRSLGGATGLVAVLVDDVDEHYRRAVAEGAEIRYGPVDQPYGYREYGAYDPERHLWSFMKPLG
jgi:MerR family transcriptional regulator, thiopeptide resistance regulator